MNSRNIVKVNLNSILIIDEINNQWKAISLKQRTHRAPYSYPMQISHKQGNLITQYNASPTFLFDKYEQSTRNLRGEPLHDMKWGFDQLQSKLHYHR